jgi:alpha-1,2-glucosyltransferase
MLYLWPYVIFFSLPLTLNSVLSPIVMRLPHGPKAFCLEHLTGEPDQATPNVFSTTLFLLCGLAAVHFNTIVHPYTLADNRHYVFYVFRNLLRHPAIIYIVVPFYFIFAWMTVRTLASPTVSMAQEKNDIQEKRSTKSDASFDSCKVSFTVVWIMTTLLSVATAPLVEPRYFIIPWIMWRLRVPYLLRSGSYEPRKKASYDVRIILETLWLLFINVITGYVFLYRGFSWPNESGVQRFLW